MPLQQTAHAEATPNETGSTGFFRTCMVWLRLRRASRHPERLGSSCPFAIGDDGGVAVLILQLAKQGFVSQVTKLALRHLRSALGKEPKACDPRAPSIRSVLLILSVRARRWFQPSRASPQNSSHSSSA